MAKYGSVQISYLRRSHRHEHNPHSVNQIVSTIGRLNNLTCSSITPQNSASLTLTEKNGSNVIHNEKLTLETSKTKPKRRTDNHKRKCSLIWIISLILMSSCILIALIIGIFVAVWNNSKSTSTILSSTTSITTTTTTTTVLLSGWNATALTVAGITGVAGTAANKLTLPFGVALDSFDTLYIADRGNHRIQKWFLNAPNGTTIAGQQNGAPGTALNCFNSPASVLVDSSGNIYTPEVLNHRVLFWSSGSSNGTLIAGTGVAGSLYHQLHQPHDIAYDWNSNILYISDYLNHRIMRYLSGATNGTIAAGGNGAGYGSTQLYNPVGLYFDSSSNSLFIANIGAHNIVRWVIGASSWTLVAGVGGSPGSTSTLLNSPGDVTLDFYGNVYVADTNNHRIQFFRVGQSNGTTIAGVTLSPGSSSTQLNSPFGLVVDSQFNVYVADYGNHRVQKFLHY